MYMFNDVVTVFYLMCSMDVQGEYNPEDAAGFIIITALR